MARRREFLTPPRSTPVTTPYCTFSLSVTHIHFCFLRREKNIILKQAALMRKWCYQNNILIRIFCGVNEEKNQAFNNQLVFESAFICMMLGGSVLTINDSHLISSKEFQLQQHYLLLNKTVMCCGFCIQPSLGWYKNCIENN